MKASAFPLILVAFGCLFGPGALAADPIKAKPALERASEDLENALRPFGFDEVRVFTWRGGFLVGKIYFQDGKNIRPIDIFDASKAIGWESYSPDAISGVLVIASKNRQCHVIYVISAEKEDKVPETSVDDGFRETSRGSVIQTTYDFKGLLPVVTGGYKNMSRSNVSYKESRGREKVTFYEINLSTSLPKRASKK